MQNEFQSREELYIMLEEAAKEIADLKQENESLKAQREPKPNDGLSGLHSILIEKASDGFWLLDNQFLTVSVNPAIEEMLGYTKEEMQGRSWYDFGDPEWVTRAKELERRRESGVKEPHRFLFIHKSGRKVLTRIATTPLYDNEGNFSGALGILSDITKQEAAEEAIKAKDMLNSIAKSAGVGMCIINPDYTIAWYNDLYVNWFGELDTTKGRNCFEVFEGRGVVCSECPSKISFDTGDAAVSERCGITTTRGSNRIFTLTTSPIKDTEGNVIQVVEISQDITERKQIEELLQSSEKRYRGLLANLEAGIVVHAPDTSIVMNNYRAAELLGLSDDQMKGKEAVDPAWKFVNEEDTQLAYDEYPVNRIIRSKKPIQNQLLGIHHPGKNDIVWVTVNGFPVLNNIGDITEMVISFIDISAGKTAADLLRDSEAKHKKMIANISDVIGIIGVDGIIKYKSPNISKWFGWEPQDLIGTDSWVTVHPEDLERIQKEFFSLLEKDGSAKAVEYRYKCKDGSYKWIELTAANQAGNPSINGVLLNYRDITERRVAEEALLKEKIRLAVILKGTNVGTWEWNIQTGEVIFNERWANLIGYTLEELAPLNIQTWITLTNSDDLAVSGKLLEKHFSRELDYYECEARMKHKNGSWVWVLDRGQVHTWDTNGKPLFMSGTHEDITRQKRIEEEISTKNKQLLALNSAKDRFFSIIAHDLKSPFHGFLGLTEMLVQSSGSFSAEKLAGFSVILNKTASNLFALLKNLLEWAQMQEGSMSFQPKEFSLFDLITETVNSMKARAEQKGITIKSNFAGNGIVFADEKMMNSVLLNLLSNAVKFTNRGGTVTVSAVRKDAQTITVSVIDTGVGMDETLVNKLFVIGEKVRSAGTDGEESTGLGLLLCKEFVEKHGGKIWVESVEGKGTKIFFTVPKIKVL